ncbi:YutD family protein [Paenibacillus yonginensis]|uniref:YutD family protein n=1 Tax=Paenibacillus yonginensis TaxID=1462996 RepID=UPI000839073B
MESAGRLTEQGGTPVFVQIGNKSYELIQDNRNGWNPEAFKQRYSEVLERYDYIVGDWGYNQLRLKGFYRDNHPKANRDTAISGVIDYINEYCNFGCAYFVLQKTKEPVKEALIQSKPDSGETTDDGKPKEQLPLREHLSSREHHAKMKQAKEASKAAAREAREAREAKEPKDGKEAKEPRGSGKETKESRESRDFKESKDTSMNKEHREPKAQRERGPQSRQQEGDNAGKDV